MKFPKIGRRAAISRMVLTAGAGTIAASMRPLRAVGGRAPEHTVTVLLDEPIGTIRPGVYSQFAEHIGGVIYDGIWVGPESKIPNIDGIRRDTDRARPAARAGRRALAGRLLRRQLPLARRHRTRGNATSPLRPLARGDRVQPVRHPRIHALLPALRRRAVFRRQRRHRHRPRSSSSGSSTATPRPARPRWPTSARTTATRAVRRALLGRRQRELGLRRQIHPGGLLPRVPQVYRMAARRTACRCT